jgi:hypothetical protein
VLAEIAMDDAQAAAIAVVEDTLTTSIASDTPRFGVARAGGFDKEWTVSSLSSYCSGAYDFNDHRFGRNTPTVAARTGMAALVPSVKIEAKCRHVRIISGLARNAKEAVKRKRHRNGAGDYKSEAAHAPVNSDYSGSFVDMARLDLCSLSGFSCRTETLSVPASEANGNAAVSASKRLLP